MRTFRTLGVWMAALAAAALAAPAIAQFSESYQFLKAVRERDGTKATEFLSKPGSVIVDTRDSASQETALHIVARERDLLWTRFLLARGANPNLKNKEGETPLMVAVRLAFPEGAEQLIKFKAQIDATNNLGETPLIRAVHQRDAIMVRMLLRAGANPNRPDSAAGLSALDYARRDTRAPGILKLLQEEKPAAPPKPVAGPK